MKIIRSLLGYTISGVLVMAVWGQLTAAGGIFGGYLASIILIGPLWFVNHYLNLVDNKDDVAWVDMGLAIGVCGIFRDIFLQGTNDFFDSLPTIALVVLGGFLGGLVAAAVEKDMAKDFVVQDNSIQEQYAPELNTVQEEFELSKGEN
ncbi:Lin0368 family putative glycerol transporter subunit [Enterococcus pingfangensis]|uniref:Lin0368 family putative glycerol transporter subunit n=1 Tax=Enterococcus pingfangensis TaxID=2559924 RepID=UPI0010FA0C52|nr:hypothetical protein [Enterococcus pingfangensis]